MSEDDDTVACLVCGDAVAEADAVYNASGAKAEGLAEMAPGESVPLDDVIAFEDGPYCSLGCSMEGADE